MMEAGNDDEAGHDDEAGNMLADAMLSVGEAGSGWLRISTLANIIHD